MGELIAATTPSGMPDLHISSTPGVNVLEM